MLTSQFTTDGQRMKQVESFKYLESISSKDGRSLTDVKLE